MKKFFLCLTAYVGGLMTTYSQESVLATDTLTTEQFTLQEVQVISSPRVFANQSVEKTSIDIRQQNIGQNLPYLLSSTPGLVATSDDGLGIGYTYFHLRGTDHTRINMTLNDIPLNDPESQTVFWVNLPDMGSSVSNLKVQRGVGSSIKGSSAFGASIQMRSIYDTKQLADDPIRAQIDFTGGMYNTFRETASIYARKGQWYMGGRFSKVNSDGYIDRSSSDLLSYQAEAGWQSFRRDDGQMTEVNAIAFGGKERTYMAWYGIDEETMKFNRRFNPAGLIPYERAKGDTAYAAYPNQTDNYTQHHAQLHVRHSFNYRWLLQAAAHYTYGRGYYEMADYGQYTDTTGWSGITQDGLTNHLGGAFVQAQYIGERWSTMFGVAGQYYACDHWGKLDQMDTYLGKGSKADGNIYARFNEYLIHRAQERLSLYEDLQYRLVDYTIGQTSEYTYSPIDFHKTYHFFNPKAGIEYFNHGHQLTASFAMANREPTRSNILEADMNGTTMPLQETLYDYELGYNYSFSSLQTGSIAGMVGANLYFMQYDNQLVATGGISKLSYPSLTNVKNSYRTGVELQYAFDFTSWLRWEGNLVWSRNKWQLTDKSWNTISFSPDWTAYNALDFHYAGFRGVINNQVVSEQYLDNSQRKEAMLKAYTVTNLQLSYLLPIKEMSGRKDVPDVEFKCLMNNLFNTLYCSNGGTDGTYTWYFPQAGFNVHAGLTVSW